MKYTGTAGVGVGLPSNTVALAGEDGSMKPLVIKNRWIYVKKCLRRKEMGGIILPDATRGDTVVSLVLAVSDDCGKFHKLTKQQKEAGELPGIEMTVKPHDKIITPDEHPWGIRTSCYGRDEYFIREEMVKCVVEE